MQEEIEQKSFNIMISTTKLSARTVLRAIKAALRLYQSKASQGKQSVRTLLRQNRGVSSVEISKTGIRGLERYAKKYGIDYAMTGCMTGSMAKDRSQGLMNAWSRIFDRFWRKIRLFRFVSTCTGMVSPREPIW